MPRAHFLPSFSVNLRFLSLSFFFLSSHSSHLSQRCRGGVESRSFCNPLTAPGYFFFLFQIFSTRPLATISKCVFSLHWCSLTFSLFFPIPLYFEVAGKLVFRSVGIAIASPLSWSLAHTRLHTNTLAHTDMHTYCSSCSFFSFITGLYGHVVLCPCTHGFLTCKDFL